MSRYLPVVLVAATLVVVLAAVAAAPAVAQEAEAASELDSLVLAVMKNADDRMARGEKLAESAAKYPKATLQWFSLMDSVRSTYRGAYMSLQKYEKAALSPEVRARHERILQEATARVVGVYQELIAQYTAAGSRTTALRLVGELKKIDPKAADKLGPDALVRVFGTKKELGDDGGRKIHPRNRAGRRLTGEEARWLGRRGYPVGPPPAPTPPPQAPAPQNPAPRTSAPRTSAPPVGGR
ncbi:MAG: hypothetical protein JXQ29_04975 [Planctomycetes bacterium]|nr:hypothetical protein [Planctomycetota bacterium]